MDVCYLSYHDFTHQTNDTTMQQPDAKQVTVLTEL